MSRHGLLRTHLVAGLGAGLVAGLAAVLLGAGAANASQGSVPAEVAAYAADPAGLVAQLDDLFGVDAAGRGIDFTQPTTVGQLNRVFTFTADFQAGVSTDQPVKRLNEWTVPITVNDAPVGLATIWINPETSEPELGDFVDSGRIASALSDVPADAYLVRDAERGAWLTIVGTEVTPAVAGSSGLTGVTSLEVYQATVVEPGSAAPQAQGASGSPDALEPGNRVVASVAVVGAAVGGVALILLVPRLVARRAERRSLASAPEAEPEPKPLQESEPDPAPKSRPKPKPAPKPKPEPAPKPKPRAKPTLPAE